MSILVVAGDPDDWPLDVPDVTVVSASTYLTDPAYAKQRASRVFNLCNSYRYQSLGYYVSLLAEARSHKPRPGIDAIEEFQYPSLVQPLTLDLNGLLQKSLAQVKEDEFTLNLYFGRNAAAHYDALGTHIFGLLQVPLLQARFERRKGFWHVTNLKPIATDEIPSSQRKFALEAARGYFSGQLPRPKRRRIPHFALAILFDSDNPYPASNHKAIQKFEKAANALGIDTEIIGRTDIERLALFDGLFIRDNTFLNHYTYQFSRRAAADGLVVIDDPCSILRCNNKVYLAELLPRYNIPIPKTLRVHRSNVQQIIPTLGLPCVLKQPDSCMSLGVLKVESAEELTTQAMRLLEISDLIVAQEYMPTSFDWRVGILDRRPLYVCKYFMAPGHWQIIKHDPAQKNHYIEGPIAAQALDDVPQDVIRTALRAANLMGDGFYGVDLKQVGRRCCVIEVNDCPTIDAGHEDDILKDALYRNIMSVFASRMAQRKGCWP